MEKVLWNLIYHPLEKIDSDKPQFVLFGEDEFELDAHYGPNRTVFDLSTFPECEFMNFKYSAMWHGPRPSSCHNFKIFGNLRGMGL